MTTKREWRRLPALPKNCQRVLVLTYHKPGKFANGEPFGGHEIAWAVFKYSVFDDRTIGGFDLRDNAASRIHISPAGTCDANVEWSKRIDGWLPYDEAVGLKEGYAELFGDTPIKELW